MKRLEMTSNPKTIGLVLEDHLGDVVLYSSILKPVRQRFPNSKIILIASWAAKELFADSPYVDQVIEEDDLILGPFKRLRVPKQRGLARRTAFLWGPSLRVDLLIFPLYFAQPTSAELQGVIKAREVIGYVGGPYIGINHRLWETNITHPIAIMENYRSKHVFDHIRHFLSEIGCEDSQTSDLKIEIELKESDYQGLAPLIASFEGEPYGVILPGCGFRPWIKEWPQERYAEVMRLLGDAGPRCWLICGAGNELQACQDVAQSLEDNCPDLRTSISCGPPLSRFAAALKEATLTIGCDNGGMHMAVALDTPTVTIVSGTIGERYFPWGNPERHRVATHPMDCWGCDYQCVHELPFCVRNITPHQVAENCKAILSHPE